MCVEVMSAEQAIYVVGGRLRSIEMLSASQVVISVAHVLMSAGSCRVELLSAEQALWSAGSCEVEMLSASQVVISASS